MARPDITFSLTLANTPVPSEEMKCSAVVSTIAVKPVAPVAMTVSGILPSLGAYLMVTLELPGV